MSDFLKDAEIAEPADHDGQVRHTMMMALKTFEFENGPITTSDGTAVADAIFEALKAKGMLLLAGGVAPHPETDASALVLARRWCRDDAKAMEWSELLRVEAARVRAAIEGVQHPSTAPTREYLTAFFDRCAGVVNRLACMLATCARYGTPSAIIEALKAIQSLDLRREPTAGYEVLIRMRELPAAFCFYAMLVGAVERRDYHLAKQILDSKIRRDHREVSFVEALPLMALHQDGWKFLTGFEQRRLPHSGALYAKLQPVFDALMIDPRRVEPLFDEVEAIISLQYGHVHFIENQDPQDWFWTPLGDYLFRNSAVDSVSYLERQAGREEALSAGLFGGSAATGKTAATRTMSFAHRARLLW